MPCAVMCCHGSVVELAVALSREVGQGKLGRAQVSVPCQ